MVCSVVNLSSLFTLGLVLLNTGAVYSVVNLLSLVDLCHTMKTLLSLLLYVSGQLKTFRARNVQGKIAPIYMLSQLMNALRISITG